MLKRTLGIFAAATLMPAAHAQSSSDIRHVLTPLHLKNASRIAQVYSFCGACSQDDACGPGNKCCKGDCKNQLMKCYAVVSCYQVDQ